MDQIQLLNSTTTSILKFNIYTCWTSLRTIQTPGGYTRNRDVQVSSYFYPKITKVCHNLDNIMLPSIFCCGSMINPVISGLRSSKSPKSWDVKLTDFEDLVLPCAMIVPILKLENKRILVNFICVFSKFIFVDHLRWNKGYV